MFKIKDTQFCMENLKMKEKKKKKHFWPSRMGVQTSDFLKFHWFELLKVMESNLHKEAKISWLYCSNIYCGLYPSVEKGK